VKDDRVRLLYGKKAFLTDIKTQDAVMRNLVWETTKKEVPNLLAKVDEILGAG
jgi:hypothetical protein